MFRREEQSGERGRREAHEGRDAIARLAKREAEAASAVRNRLERQSSGGARLNFVGVLNAIAKVHAVKEAPGFVALETIRRGQSLGRRTAADHNRTHDKLERAGFLRGLID
jgi:hypothetical protein